MPALVIGILGIVGAVFGFVTDAPEFYRAWLAPFVFWFLIAAGALAVLACSTSPAASGAC